eukprot:ctg_172.g86
MGAASPGDGLFTHDGCRCTGDAAAAAETREQPTRREVVEVRGRTCGGSGSRAMDERRQPRIHPMIRNEANITTGDARVADPSEPPVRPRRRHAHRPGSGSAAAERPSRIRFSLHAVVSKVYPRFPA